MENETEQNIWNGKISMGIKRQSQILSINCRNTFIIYIFL